MFLPQIAPYYPIDNFMNHQCLSDLIKGPTCIKSANGLLIYSEQQTNIHLKKKNSFETDVSNHHHLIATVLKQFMKYLHQSY